MIEQLWMRNWQAYRKTKHTTYLEELLALQTLMATNNMEDDIFNNFC